MFNHTTLYEDLQKRLFCFIKFNKNILNLADILQFIQKSLYFLVKLKNDNFLNNLGRTSVHLYLNTINKGNKATPLPISKMLFLPIYLSFEKSLGYLMTYLIIQRQTASTDNVTQRSQQSSRQILVLK